MADNNDLRKQNIDLKASEVDAAKTKKKNLYDLDYVRNLREQESITDKELGRMRNDASNELTALEKALKNETKLNTAETDLSTDMAVADSKVAEVLGEAGNLGRIRDDAAVQDAQSAYAKATDLSLVRDRATEGLQGAEQSSNRQLMARLGQSGVKGGLAGGALTDMASQNLRNRAGLERDLAVQNVAANKDRAQFETQLAQFDLGQAAAEKNLQLQTKLGLTQYSQLQRSGMKQADIMKNMGSSQGGGK